MISLIQCYLRLGDINPMLLTTWRY